LVKSAGAGEEDDGDQQPGEPHHRRLLGQGKQEEGAGAGDAAADV
jgi:hypothetical protein